MKNTVLAILLSFTATACGYTESIAIKGEASNSCAPWDGRSISIKLNIENQDLFMNIWGFGMKRIYWGDNILLKKNGDHEADGNFRACVKGTIQCTSMDFELRDIEFSEDIRIEGEFTFNEKNYKFTAPFNSTEPAMCG